MWVAQNAAGFADAVCGKFVREGRETRIIFSSALTIRNS